jgi:hypothetical protein
VRGRSLGSTFSEVQPFSVQVRPEPQSIPSQLFARNMVRSSFCSRTKPVTARRATRERPPRRSKPSTSTITVREASPPFGTTANEAGSVAEATRSRSREEISMPLASRTTARMKPSSAGTA